MCVVSWKLFFLALTFTSLVGVPINLLLHEIIDPNYKERIADYKLERQLNELEKYGDSKKISYTFNEEKFRQDVLKNYTRTFFLTNPIRTILINLVFSLIFSAIFSKFGTEEDLIIAHKSPEKRKKVYLNTSCILTYLLTKLLCFYLIR